MDFWIFWALFIGFGQEISALYPGSKSWKRFSDVPNEGPNVCGYRWGLNICCSGWSKNIKSQCLIPICAGNCGERGECVRPDVCRCYDGKERSECMTLEMGGYDYEESDNEVPSLWQNDQPVGGDFMINKAEPSLVNRSEKSYCFLSNDRGLCREQLGLSNYPDSDKYAEMFKTTMYQCCNTFGKAWGKEKCQDCDMLMERALKCKPGYEPNEDGICIDIDECTLGICQNGACKNLEGNFTCSCPHGMFFNQTILNCDYKRSICELNPDLCGPQGYCRESPDSDDFTCICMPGYELGADNRSCVKKQEAPFNLCSIYKDKVCRNGECVPRGLNYECFCKDGFRTSHDRKSCLPEVNLCNVRKDLCRNGVCIPLGVHGYTCKCQHGFRLSETLRSCLRDTPATTTKE